MPAILTRPARAAPGITIAGYGDWFQRTFDPAVLEPFRTAHRDITVFYYPVGDAFQTLGMLRTQRDFPSTDIVLLEPGAAVRGKAEGLLETLDSASLPVMKDLSKQALKADLPGPGMMFDSLALGYNPAKLGRPPRTWRDLWDPAYGSVGLESPPDPLGLAITAVAAGLYGDGNLTNSLDIALTALSELGPRVSAWDPIPDIYTAIAVDDATIGPCWNARGQAQASLTPDRFATVIPAEGSPYLTTTVNLVKSTRNREAALTLIRWLLAPDAQRLLAEAMFYAPVNTRTELPPALQQKVGAAPGIAGKRIEVDWVGMTAMRNVITADWRARNLAAH